MYIVCIMSLVWRTGTTDDANRGPMTPGDAFAFRIIVTAVLSLGLIYSALIGSTLRRYGEMMDQAWHRRIVSWINGTVTPAPAESRFGPSPNLYSTDMPYPHSKKRANRSKPSPTHSHISHSSSRPAFRQPTPPAEFSFSNLAWEHDRGADPKHRVIVSQLASKDESLSRNLKIPVDASTPLPPFSSVSAPTPAHPLHLLEEIPDEVYHEMMNDPGLSQVPIKLARFLLLTFEDDHPLDVPPSDKELNACHMTKDLWKALQTVSVISLKCLPFRSTKQPQDTQQFGYPLHPGDMAGALHEWNRNIFSRYGVQIALCKEFTDAESSRFALYCFSTANVLPPAEGDNYSPLPEGLRRLDIFDFSSAPINTVADVPTLVTEDSAADCYGVTKISLISSNLDVSG